MSNDVQAIQDGIKALQDKLSGEIQSGLKAQDEKLELALTDLGQRGDSIKQLQPGVNPLAKITGDAQLKSLQDRSIKSASFNIDQNFGVLIKAVTGDAGADLYEVQPQRANGIGNDPRRVLGLLDVLPLLQAGSNSFQFNRLDGYTNAADYQTVEGAIKPGASMPTDLVSVPITTIAHFIKASEQVIADAPALLKQIESLLRYGVQAKAEAQLIAGATAGKIQGLATQATAFTSTAGASLADAIGEAQVAMEVDGWRPGLVLLHPNDWFAIRSERAVVDGTYIANGWAGAAERSVWGMQVLTNPSVTAGTPLVLDPSQVAVLDRMSVRVEMGREADDFTRNLVTILAECRIGLAVFSPAAVRKVAIGV